MKRSRVVDVVLAAAIVCLGSAFVFPTIGQAENPSGQAQMIITVRANNSRPAALLQRNDVAVKVKNRPADIVDWAPLTGSNAGLQLVFLFDESARSSLAQQIPSLTSFINSLPSSAAVGIAYMGNGQAIMAGPMTTDHTQAVKYLRLTTGFPGISGSSYFCLSDLVKHWPSQEKTARRVVLMVTNGLDLYAPGQDLQDPYVSAAIQDSQKAGVLVYSIYFADQTLATRRGSSQGILYGQDLLLRVADATGGETYAIGLANPVSFDPFLQQFRQSLNNQYLLTLATTGSGWQQVSVKSKVSGVKLAAPNAMYMGRK